MLCIRVEFVFTLTIQFLHRDVGELVALAVLGQRAAQVVPLIEQPCRHMVEGHLLPVDRPHTLWLDSRPNSTVHCTHFHTS